MEPEQETSQFQKIPSQVPSKLQELKNLIPRSNHLYLGITYFVLMGMLGYIFIAPESIKNYPTTLKVPAQKIQPTLSILVTPSEIATSSPTSIITLTITPISTLAPTATSIPTPTPTPIIPTPTYDPLSSWGTYRNTEYNYSIKYPPGWKILDLGELEPKIPSYVAFNSNEASLSSRFITISSSTRTFQEQLAIGGIGTPITVGPYNGAKQYFQDSNGQQSVAIVLPRANDIIILRSKTDYLGVFNLMLPTLKLD